MLWGQHRWEGKEGKKGEGREGSRAGLKEKFVHDAVSVKTSVDPIGWSKGGMSLKNCPHLGRES